MLIVLFDRMASMDELRKEVANLREQLANEQKKIQEMGAVKRGKIEKMSAEVVDSNPYRLVDS